MGIEQSIYSTSTLVIALLCVHAPRGRYRAPFLSHPPPLSDGNLHPAALLRMRGNYFRPYLSIFACAIEVQHYNENSTTILEVDLEYPEELHDLHNDYTLGTEKY